MNSDVMIWYSTDLLATINNPSEDPSAEGLIITSFFSIVSE